MNIALDYDKTYTLDPYFWSLIIGKAIAHGHDVRIVTARHETLDKIPDDPRIKIIYCNGVAKDFYCRWFVDWIPDVWIDDNPKSVYNNSTATADQLQEWRKTRVE